MNDRRDPNEAQGRLDRMTRERDDLRKAMQEIRDKIIDCLPWGKLLCEIDAIAAVAIKKNIEPESPQYQSQSRRIPHKLRSGETIKCGDALDCYRGTLSGELQCKLFRGGTPIPYGLAAEDLDGSEAYLDPQTGKVYNEC